MIRATVRTFAIGKVTGAIVRLFSRSHASVVVDRLRQLAADAVNLRKIVDTGARNALQTAELPQQLPPLARAEPRDGLQDRFACAPWRGAADGR